MRETSKELLAFIEKSPSCFHAVANLAEMLRQEGFVELDEAGEWELVPAGKYYVIRNDSAIIAFQIPENKVKGFHIVASHSDSPTFKIKEKPETVVEGHYLKLNTEKYGGMILSTWLDRPLSIAGRIAVQDENQKIRTRLVNIDRDLLIIPNVAIHMNREMNKGVEYNPQVDMLPLMGDCTVAAEAITAEAGTADTTAIDTEAVTSGSVLLRECAKAAKTDEKKILGQDLFLYVRDHGRILGVQEDFIVSPRLDDLQCAFSSMKAYGVTRPGNYITLCAVFDNEEVGSMTGQGADSTFLSDVLERIGESLAQNGESAATFCRRMIAGGFLISADNAHGVHPNHPEKADPTNRPYLNGGIVIKYHGSQKYTTDACSAAYMKALCESAGVPFQTYANRSDIAGGSTLGNISTSHVSISSVDIGLAQLAMHSAVETAGVKDTEYAVRVFETFFAE